MIQYVVIFGALISAVGGYAYIRDTLKGITKPNRITWFLWALAPLIGTVAAITDGVTWAVLPVFMAGFIPLLIFLSSFKNKKAYWKLSAFDYSLGALSLFTLVIWAITNQPILAITLAIIADALAAIPTLSKAWKFPETETGIAYVASLVGTLTGFFAVKSWTFSEYGFLIYLTVMILSLIFAIYRKKILKLLSVQNTK